MAEQPQEAAEQIAVVVDANVIIQSPRLSSGAWRAALHAQQTGVLDLRVPELCVLEAVAWMERELPARVTKFRKAMSDLDRVGVRLELDPWAEDPLGVGRLAGEADAAYESYLRGRLAGCKILPIPEVAHEQLIRRAVRRVRPFNDAGSGYRDALIWEAVCREALLGQAIVFVSNNTRDFADSGELAGALQDDLADRGLTRGAVTLATSLLDVVTRYAPEATDAKRVAEVFLADRRALECLEEELNEAFAQYEGIPYPGQPGELHPLLSEPVIEAVWNLRDVEIGSVKPDGDMSYLVVGTASATGRAYSRHEAASPSDVAAAHAARDAGTFDDVFEDGPDLVVIKFIPVRATFAATFDPPGHVWNAGVIDIERLDAT